MTKLRSELLQQSFDRNGTPFRSWMVARMPKMEALGTLVRPLYNFFASWNPSAWLIKKMVSFSIKRDIPQLSRHGMRYLVRKESRKHAWRRSWGSFSPGS